MKRRVSSGLYVEHGNKQLRHYSACATNGSGHRQVTDLEDACLWRNRRGQTASRENPSRRVVIGGL
jgi:hypothetical protein